MKNLLATLSIATLAGCVVPIPAGPAPSSPSQGNDLLSSSAATETAGFTQSLNAFRASQGQGSVTQSIILTRAATLHAQDMDARGYFSHSSPGGPNGDDISQRASAAGCNFRALAENIAQGQKSDGEVFTAWQNSPGHRANMLGQRYTSYGLGRSGDTWVMMLSSGC